MSPTDKVASFGYNSLSIAGPLSPFQCFVFVWCIEHAWSNGLLFGCGFDEKMYREVGARYLAKLTFAVIVMDGAVNRVNATTSVNSQHSRSCSDTRTSKPWMTTTKQN